ncbi:cytochrome P450 [Pseudonocardia petroleophila]|uniref:Cytochrome P450 n=1 Tax=Pseudonocardia petroleophila TaxID=37331 RepID=A0A7G7MLK7_9PSEU|nr:cytochrome P450 [Pseudonocardia petroleophila]QNG53668.1 cytochrome P450 [Pseudonocardia petroleophila]
MLPTSPPTVRFDPLDQDMRFHDFGVYDEIRAAGGVAWSPERGGFWAVADHALARQIASDHGRFRSAAGVRIPPNGTPPTFALEYDRPEHTGHRKILTAAVGPRVAPGLDAMVRGHARALLATGADGRLDLGAGYAFRLSLDVMFELIGAPGHLKDEVELLAEALFLYRTPLPDGRDAAGRLREILQEMVASRTAEPRGDWLSEVVARGRDTEHPLSEQEVHGAIVALLVGGHHSTARATACLLAHVVTHPELQETLRAAPERIPEAVEEAVRMWTPLRWFARTAAEDVGLGGVTVRAGERVLLLYAGANRDPQRFAEPDEFVLGQSQPNTHLAFGWGIHRCVGMPLAQLEVRVAVEELFAATEWVAPYDDITWTSSTEPRRIPCALR